MNAPAQPMLVNASRFRAAHEVNWKRLDGIVTRIERRGIGALTEDDLLMLPLLYRSALSSLSVARETSLDRALVTYLEALCTRAYFQIYGVPTSFWTQLKDFFVRGWPQAVQGLWRETLASFTLTLVAALAGFLTVMHDPTLFYTIMPDSMAQGRDPSASAQALHDTLYNSKHQRRPKTPQPAKRPSFEAATGQVQRVLRLPFISCRQPRQHQGELRLTMHAGLLEDTVQMQPRGARGNTEPLGDPRHLLSLRGPRRYLCLGPRQSEGVAQQAKRGCLIARLGLGYQEQRRRSRR